MTFTQFAESHGVIIKSLKASDKIQRGPTVAHRRATTAHGFGTATVAA